ncbi:MAG: BBP7 family outer membrane beta-barrel protein [Gemmatales bacterium]
MRNGLLAALIILLAWNGWASAQELQASAEYLHWWTKNSSIPPLATAGGDGKIGSPGTKVLVDNLDFVNNPTSGSRFSLSYRPESMCGMGIEANYFFLAERRGNLQFSSEGDPLLAQPFINVANGQPDANLVAAPGAAAGTINVGARTGLWGTEANLTSDLFRSDTFHLKALVGFRYLQLSDEVAAEERFLVADDIPGFGGSRVHLQDDFQTLNQFYGGQVGIEAGMKNGPFIIDVRGKIALGEMNQNVDIAGSTFSRSRDGSTTLFEGGLYALRTNIGSYRRSELAFIPEVDVNLGWQLTSQLKLTAGYSFLWINSVVRAGEQIDPVINTTVFPIRSGDGPLVGPARPAFTFDRSEFWAQGLSIGLELRY